MIAGVMAVIVLLIPRTVRNIAGFHIFGLADFAVAVGAGVTLNALDPASMSNVVMLPVALIPLIAVPLYGATNIAALHMLRTGQHSIKR